MKKNNSTYIIQLITLSILVSISHLSAAQDPGAVGPHNVLSTSYNRGDQAFTPSGFPAPVEVKASVHYPSNLNQGNFPLVVFMHGRHSPCYSEEIRDDGAGEDIITYNTYSQWPCSGNRRSIPSYQDYNYAAQILASHGYIVVSISANGISARDGSVSDGGMDARARLIQHHLNLWNGFNTSSSGDFGSLFVGKVDMDNIGTMGHSRGGEGAAEHYILNKSLGSPYGIKAVLPMAPTNAKRAVVEDVPLGVILPYCDGDVRDLSGIHFYDDARYALGTDNPPKHTFLVMGANHNFASIVKAEKQLIPSVKPHLKVGWLITISAAMTPLNCIV